jgi:hypothetical protein
MWLRDHAVMTSEERTQEHLGLIGKMLTRLEEEATWDVKTMKSIKHAFHPDNLECRPHLKKLGKYIFERINAMLSPSRARIKSPFIGDNDYGTLYMGELNAYRATLTGDTYDRWVHGRDKYVTIQLASGVVPQFIADYVNRHFVDLSSSCDEEEEDDMSVAPMDGGHGHDSNEEEERDDGSILAPMDDEDDMSVAPMDGGHGHDSNEEEEEEDSNEEEEEEEEEEEDSNEEEEKEEEDGSILAPMDDEDDMSVAPMDGGHDDDSDEEEEEEEEVGSILAPMDDGGDHDDDHGGDDTGDEAEADAEVEARADEDRGHANTLQLTFLAATLVTHDDADRLCPVCDKPVEGLPVPELNMLERIRASETGHRSRKSKGWRILSKHEQGTGCRLWGLHIFHSAGKDLPYNLATLYVMVLQKGIGESPTLRLGPTYPADVETLKVYIDRCFTFTTENFAVIRMRKKLLLTQATRDAFRTAWEHANPDTPFTYDFDERINRNTAQLTPYIQTLSTRLSSVMLEKLDDIQFGQYVATNFTPAAFLNQLMMTLTNPGVFWSNQSEDEGRISGNIFIPNVESILP